MCTNQFLGNPVNLFDLETIVKKVKKRVKFNLRKTQYIGSITNFVNYLLIILIWFRNNVFKNRINTIKIKLKEISDKFFAMPSEHIA